MKKLQLSLVLLISTLISACGTTGVPMPDMHFGESAVFEKAVYVSVGASKSSVISTLGEPTKRKLNYTEAQTIKAISSLFPAYYANYGVTLKSDEYDIWYYEGKKIKTYMGLLSNTRVTVYKQCYFVFNTLDVLEWKNCTKGK